REPRQQDWGRKKSPPIDLPAGGPAKSKRTDRNDLWATTTLYSRLSRLKKGVATIAACKDIWTLFLFDFNLAPMVNRPRRYEWRPATFAEMRVRTRIGRGSIAPVVTTEC